MLKEFTFFFIQFSYLVKGRYLVDGPNCRIPNTHPFSKHAIENFEQFEYENCSRVQPLTFVEIFGDDEAYLVVRTELLKEYFSWWQNDHQVSLNDFAVNQNLVRLNREFLLVLLPENLPFAVQRDD